jgi:hypothetical protein
LNCATKFDPRVALKTPFEVRQLKYSDASAHEAPQRALGQTSWKEYFQEGRKYYYNVRDPNKPLVNLNDL